MTEGHMESRMLKIEGSLRLLSVVLATVTACVLGLDKQTKVIFVKRTATVKALSPLWILTISASVAGGYQLLQLVKCLVFGLRGKRTGQCSKALLWVCLVLDQVVMYGMVCITAAAIQASSMGVTGSRHLQWMKVCSLYKRFCVQVGGGLLCALAAFLAMSMLAFFSTYLLSRNHYSRRTTAKR